MKSKLFTKIIFLLISLICILCLTMTVSNATEEVILQEPLEVNEAISQEQPEIEETIVEVYYEYVEHTNTVIATMRSNNELQDTKVSWELSEDKKQYTFEFGNNTTYMTNVVDIYGNTIPVQINVTQIDESPAIVEVYYEYKEETNTVIARMSSNRKLQATKVSWKLSEDKKEYTFEFGNNTRYMTNVVDRFGNVIPVEINVVDVRTAAISVLHVYDIPNGQIIVDMVSDTPLKDTKPSWKLSEDQLTYTKIFYGSINYTTPVEDMYGNIIQVEINIPAPVANITTYNEYDATTNQELVRIISDIPLKDTKPSWTLSEDKLNYTKIFTSNMAYSTPVQDIYGNIINVDINVEQIDTISPEITVEYQFNEDETVTVFMKSNEPLGDTKPNWNLSPDQMTYEHTFNTNQNYTTLVKDIYGNKTNVKIEFRTRVFTYEQEDDSIIKVRYLYIESKTAIVDIISSIQMNDTKPSWQLSEDGHKYTKIFTTDNTYTTPIQDINGVSKDVKIMVNISQSVLKGIDVSKHNGKIDWEKVRNDGIDFAIIRVGYGQDMKEQDDPRFEYNISECERLGIPYGVYLYSYALNTENASSEADHVLRLIKGHNPEFGIWYDIEDEDKYKQNNGMPTNEEFTEIAITFCEKIKANGYQNVGIYASLDWLNNKLNSPKLDKYDKWVAQWGDKCTYEKDYVMWQYSATGQVDGITANDGKVDMNLYYKSK